MAAPADKPDVRLRGKTALVTGAARRLGAAIARALAVEGVRLVLHYNRSADEVASLREEFRSQGAACWTVEADLSRAGEAEALFDRAVEQAGPLDMLVNNASIFPAGTLWDASLEDFHANLDVNALAPFLLARRLAAQARPAAIVNLLDARMVDYDREHAAYHLSKRALFSLTRMAALEFAPRVRVNAVAPGLILPPEGMGEEYLEALAPTAPLQRHGDVADVANAVVFLLANDYITGQVIFVDGGRHLRGSMYGC